MNGRPWTKEEDDVLRALATTRQRRRTAIPLAKIARKLPHRTPRAIGERIKILKIRKAGAAWTKAEDKILLRDWSEDGRRTLETRLPGRSWCAIFMRARRLGLPSMPQGYVTMTEAARRAGMMVPSVRAVCARWNVNIRKHTTKDYKPKRGKTRHHEWHLVEWDAFEEALRRDLQTETIAAAARRLGMHRVTLRERLMRAGLHTPALAHKGRQFVRLAPAVYDQIVSAA